VLAKIGSFTTAGSDMLIQPDQNIVVAGYYDDGSTTGFAVMRFLPNGTLDPNFGSGGKVSIAFANYIFGSVKVGIQTTQKLVLMGEFGLPNEGREAVLVRLAADGSLDLGFSPTGYLVIPAPIQAYAMAIQADDKILVGGNGSGNGVDVARYSADGVLDNTFGTNGLATLTGGPVNAMTVDGAGRIITVGGGGATAFTQVSCFTHTGFPDPQFGVGGVTPVSVGNSPVFLDAVSMQTDGYILAAGQYLPSGTNTKYRFMIVRLRPDGSLDPGFSGNGKQNVAFPSASAFATAVLQDWQGFIYAAGIVEPTNGAVHTFGLCRLTVNGALDTRFGTIGVLTTGWSGQSANATAFAQQQNGKLVVAGYAGLYDAVARYNNPFVLSPPPFVTSSDPGSISQLGSGLAPTGLRVFPNPVRSLLHVQGLDAKSSTLLLVRDAAGNALMSVKLEQQSEYSLDVHRLEPGTYFLELTAEGGRKSFPFVKAP